MKREERNSRNINIKKSNRENKREETENYEIPKGTNIQSINRIEKIRY
jgi:hypothetical protein